MSASKTKIKIWNRIKSEVSYFRSSFFVAKLTITENTKNRKLFGTTLDEICNNDGSPVPDFLIQSAKLLESAFSVDGLFTTNPNKGRISLLHKKVEQAYSSGVDLEEPLTNHVQPTSKPNGMEFHEVAAVMKLFLCKLQEPVIPQSKGQELISASKLEGKQRVQKFVSILTSFPECNRETLLFIIGLLYKCARSHFSQRIHTTGELARAYGPVLFYGSDQVRPENYFAAEVTRHLILEFKFLNSSVLPGTPRNYGVTAIPDTPATSLLDTVEFGTNKENISTLVSSHKKFRENRPTLKRAPKTPSHLSDEATIPVTPLSSNANIHNIPPSSFVTPAKRVSSPTSVKPRTMYIPKAPKPDPIPSIPQAEYPSTPKTDDALSDASSRPETPKSPLTTSNEEQPSTPDSAKKANLLGYVEKYVALHPFTARNEQEISFVPGDIITVIQKDDSGWWYGETSSHQKGLFPFNYTKKQEASFNFRISRRISTRVLQLQKECGFVKENTNSNEQSESHETKKGTLVLSMQQQLMADQAFPPRNKRSPGYYSRRKWHPKVEVTEQVSQPKDSVTTLTHLTKNRPFNPNKRKPSRNRRRSPRKPSTPTQVREGRYTPSPRSRPKSPFRQTESPKHWQQAPAQDPIMLAELETLRKALEQEQSLRQASEQQIRNLTSTIHALESSGKQQEKSHHQKMKSKKHKIHQLKKEIHALKDKADKDVKSLTTRNETLGQQVKSLEIELADSTLKINSLTKELEVAKANYKEEQTLRKKYYNMVEDMKGTIRVFCRVRPLGDEEKAKGQKCTLSFGADEMSLNVHDPKRGTLKSFQYDRVFGPDAKQEDVFKDTSFLIQSAVDGYNVCIFAYGQTGSGKTHTMTGSIQQPGLTPRILTQLFHIAETQADKFKFTIKCHMVELYNDRLIDLLYDGKKEAPKLAIKKNDRGMVYLQNVTTQKVTSLEEINKFLLQGTQSRHTASTDMNAHSSRSHSIFTIVIKAKNLTTLSRSTGKLTLVDLAGSERVSKSGATAERLKEAQSINKSLTALADVISALSNKENFIPYRNNKLTQLLSDSMGGNAKTLMFCNLAPSDFNYDETISSLNYASRVKLITNEASKTVENKDLEKMRKIVDKLLARSNLSLDELVEMELDSVFK